MKITEKPTSISILLFPIERLSTRYVVTYVRFDLMGQRLLLKYIFWKLDSFLKRNAYRGKWKGSENAELVNSSRIRANCSIHIIFRLTSTTAGVTRDVSARLIILSLSIKKNKKTTYRSLFRLLITFDAFLFSITET